jgi:hypothetical protein
MDLHIGRYIYTQKRRCCVPLQHSKEKGIAMWYQCFNGFGACKLYLAVIPMVSNGQLIG